MRRSEPRPGASIKYLITPEVIIRELKESGSFKASVLKDLEQAGNKIDIRQLVRGYMDSFARVHKSVRNLLKDKTESAEAILAKEESQLEGFPERTEYWRAISFDDQGRILDDLFMRVKEVCERRKFLEGRSALATQFLKSYVTAEIESHP
jgi:hypothetical protein